MTLAMTTDVATTAGDRLVGVRKSAHRHAFYLNGQAGHCFAWLHEHPSQTSLNHGVVICAPLGYEQIHAHRGLRHLADTLAMHHLPTLRFDWHGTGDSPGGDDDANRVQTWLSNLQDAITWMRNTLGCEHVSVVGLRLGGTLAALAAAETQIDNLILWAPVVKGRAYVREMKAISLTSDAPARSTVPSNDIEAAGFILTAETAVSLSAIDLMNSPPDCGRVLIATRSDHPDDRRLYDHWSSLRKGVEQITTTGFTEMLAEPHHTVVPQAAIQQLTDWLMHATSDSTRPIAPQHHRTDLTSIEVPVSGTQKAIRETTFAMEVEPELFGVISAPTEPVSPDAPIIVLLNAGSTYRVGPNRLNVQLARRLASEGFRCLRIDLSGLGDSLASSEDRENDPYPATAFRDIDRIIGELQQQHGVRRVVLAGLCSGAYAAFQAAAQIHNPALVESVLMNPLTFFWKEGMTLNDSPTKELRSFHYYQSVAIDPKKWLKLLSGRSKIGVRGAISMVFQRYRRRKSTAANSPSSDCSPLFALSHPQKEDLRGDLDRIEHAGRHLAMFFSESDPGYDILTYHAKLKAHDLQKRGHLTIEFIEEADHTFTVAAARGDLIDRLVRHLHQRYPSQP